MTAFTLTYFAIPSIIKIARAKNLCDEPVERAIARSIDRSHSAVANLDADPEARTLIVHAVGTSTADALRAGEMVIFHERTMHCALPNSSDRRRLGLNCRICKPSVTVYPDATEVDAWVFGQTWSLDKWRPLLLRGKDEHGANDCVSVDSVRDEIARHPVDAGAVTDAA